MDILIDKKKAKWMLQSFWKQIQGARWGKMYSKMILTNHPDQLKEEVSVKIPLNDY